ncbi:hypothetical protein A8F75_36520 [Burkholderia cenocepacia]|nr:hypothetical protein TQ36_09475 [Burkholderia cenocepacia]AQQ50849.1 hypothetical protein A8F32_34985 [Burkholderia cenocepacia]ONJ06094.1 hypothetical protein A8F53_05490 [Burkholderia cenocepacia]ONJ08234.1 hypothetical protein A8F33_17470 [Burkholderia cenocepacia]ONJ25536.1 hypothetical protein A8F38_31595 [Burkholderia cenocepacia]
MDRGARWRTDAGARFGRRVEPAGPRAAREGGLTRHGDAAREGGLTRHGDAAREGGLTRHGDAARDAPCRQSRSFSIAGL